MKEKNIRSLFIGQILSILIIIFILFILGLFCYSIITNWDLVFNSLLNNIAIFVPLIIAVLSYSWNEHSKLKERQQRELDRQKDRSMQVYQNYLNNHFCIMRDKDFSQTNENVLKSREILQSQLPLFVPDDVLIQLALIQENARKLYFHQMKKNEIVIPDLEKDTLNGTNKLIELMRKDLLPNTKITDKDIGSLLGTSYELLQSVRAQENIIEK